MRILVFYPYIPFPVDRGTYQRTFHLLREMARRHEVDLLAMSEKGERLEQRPVFDGFCRRVEFVSFEHPPWPSLFPGRILHPIPTTIRHWRLSQVGAALDRFAAGQSYAVAHICDIVLAQYFMGCGPGLPVAVDRSRVDLQFQRAQRDRMSRGLKNRFLDWENLVKMLRFERRVARRVATEIVGGPDDKKFIHAEIDPATEVFVLANGVDLEFFRPDASDAPRAAAPTTLFCGAMDYSPNIDALRWYFAEIHPRLAVKTPGLRVLIVGKSPTEEVRAFGRFPGVTVVGGVPDVRPYYREAWLQIIPLRIGGGTRLKIPESLAMGTPVVSTTIGAQGLDLAAGREILLADTAEEFAAQTALALSDGGLRARLEADGAKAVNERLGWPGLVRRLCEYYEGRFKG